MEQIKKDGINESRSQSTPIMISYSLGNLMSEAFFFIFGTYFYFFYEVEVGLSIWLVSLGYTIYAIWNAINDPIIGVFTDRPNRMWKRWGKRFPFVFIGILGWIFTLALLFTPPDVSAASGSIILFIWLIFSACLCDTLFSLGAVNYGALYPDKFRTDGDRRKVAGYGNIFALLGTLVGAIIPPMFITYGDISSYATMSWLVIIILLVAFVFYIPGIRETKWMKERYLERWEVEKAEKISFVDTVRRVFKQKNYVVFMVVYLVSDIASACLMASLNYEIIYVLNESTDALLFIMLIYVLSSIISIPFWVLLSQRIKNNKKVFIISCIANAAFLIPMGFINILWAFLIGAVFLGIGMAGFKVNLTPLSGDALDEALVLNKRHMESSYGGFMVFILRFSLVAQALIFGIVHTLTGFDTTPGATQPPAAVFGIQLHFALIPAVLFIIGIIIFWKYYGLTPEKTKELKEKIKELQQ